MSKFISSIRNATSCTSDGIVLIVYVGDLGKFSSKDSLCLCVIFPRKFGVQIYVLVVGVLWHTQPCLVDKGSAVAACSLTNKTTIF